MARSRMSVFTVAQQSSASSTASDGAAGNGAAAVSALKRASASAVGMLAASPDSPLSCVTTAATEAPAEKKNDLTPEERTAYISKLGVLNLPADKSILRFLDDTVASTPLPPPWGTRRDKRKRLYYVNTATRESSWHHPLEAMLKELAPVCRECLTCPAEDREAHVRQVHAGWMQDAQDELQKWYEASDQNGQPYFYHGETNQTMWENPAEVILPTFSAKLKAITKLIDEEYVVSVLGARSMSDTHDGTGAKGTCADDASSVSTGTRLDSLGISGSGLPKTSISTVALPGNVAHGIVTLQRSQVGHITSSSAAEMNEDEVREALEAQAAVEASVQAAAQSFHEERRRHEEVLKQQNHWQAERKALQEEMHQILAEQQAHALQVQRQEEAQEEQRRMQSARRQEELHAEHHALHIEMRQMLELQQATSSNFEQKAKVRNAEQKQLEDALRQVFEERRAQSEEDECLRHQWEVQNQKLQSELHAALKLQHTGVARAQDQGMRNHDPDCLEGGSSGTPDHSPPSSPAAAVVHGAAHQLPTQLPTLGSCRPLQQQREEVTEVTRHSGASSEQQSSADSWQQQQQEQEQQSMQTQLSELTSQLAAQRAVQKSLAEENLLQQQLAEEVRQALSLHSESFEEISQFLAQQKAHHEASSNCDGDRRNQNTELTEHILAEIRRSQAMHSSMLLEAQAQSRIDVQRQIEEALDKKQPPNQNHFREELESEIFAALEDKHKDILEASSAAVNSLQQHVSEALVPLTQHVVSLEGRQQEAIEAIRLRSQNAAEENRAHAVASATCANVAARQEAAQQRLTEEVHESLEFQRIALCEAQTRVEQAAKYQIEEMMEMGRIGSSHKEFEVKLQRMLEDKQRDILDKSHAMTCAVQKQLTDALVPLSRHVEEVERRQKEDIARSRMAEQQAHLQLESELRHMRDSEERALETQRRTEAAIQSQVTQALEAIQRQLADLETKRAEDAERAKAAEILHRLQIEDERDRQRREEQSALQRMQAEEEEQRIRNAEMRRLEDELRRTREMEMKSREQDIRRQMEWQAEKRELEWRAEHKELEWKSRLRQLQWRADWQAAQELEESHLLLPSAPVLTGQARSQGGFVASQGSPTNSGRRSSSLGANSRPQSSGRSSGRPPGRQRSKEPVDPEEAIDRFIDYAIPLGDRMAPGCKVKMPRPKSAQRTRTSARNTDPALRSAVRPKRLASTGECPTSHRSLADEVAADLDESREPSARESAPVKSDSEPALHRQQPLSATTSKQGGRAALSYRQLARHSHKWFDLQQARQRDKQTRSATVFSLGVDRPSEPTALGEVFRTYPEVSHVLAGGKR